MTAAAPIPPALLHRHGGQIEAITDVGHNTYKGVASWFFIGRVRWQDGSYSDAIDISPNLVCHDGTPASEARVRALMATLNDYLERAGTWHEPVHTRDGRVYSWSPRSREGREAVREVVS